MFTYIYDLSEIINKWNIDNFRHVFSCCLQMNIGENYDIMVRDVNGMWCKCSSPKNLLITLLVKLQVPALFRF